MIECADSTMLRVHLDNPDADLERHLDACDDCAGLIRSVAADAGFAHRRLALLDPAPHEPAVDVEAALRVVSAKVPRTLVAVTPTAAPARRVPVRRLALAGAALIVAVVVGVTPVTRNAVAATLDAFRGERLQAMSVDIGNWSDAPIYEGIQALERLGTLDLSGLDEPRLVADEAEAAELAGIVAPNLPDEPDRLVALEPGVARIVLERTDDNEVPAALDGAALVLDVPGSIGAIWGSTDGPPQLVMGRSGSLSVRAEGAPLEEIRSFLLSVDELPEDLRAQLADIGNWRSTIPVPVPIDGPGWRDVELSGRQAIVFGDDSGLGAIVLRQDPDGVTVVGGRITADRAVDLASAA